MNVLDIADIQLRWIECWLSVYYTVTLPYWPVYF